MYAAVVRGSEVEILAESAPPTRIAIPAGCRFSTVGGSAIAFLCAEDRTLRAYDLDSRTWTSTSAPSLFGGDGGPSLTMGRRWIEAVLDSCYHCDVVVTHLDRNTGKMGPREPRATNVHLDLDDHRLWAPLCSPFRRTRNPDFDPEFGSPFRFVEPLMSGRYGVEFDVHGWLVLRRCGSRRVTVLTRSHDAQLVQIGGGVVSWLDQSPIPEEDGPGHAVAYDIARGNWGRWRIPGAANSNVSVSHTRGHLYVDKRGTTGRASRRYVAAL
jgi:hypothetical protein